MYAREIWYPVNNDSHLFQAATWPNIVKLCPNTKTHHIRDNHNLCKNYLKNG